jgi:hypothetical protein
MHPVEGNTFKGTYVFSGRENGLAKVSVRGVDLVGNEGVGSSEFICGSVSSDEPLVIEGARVRLVVPSGAVEGRTTITIIEGGGRKIDPQTARSLSPTLNAFYGRQVDEFTITEPINIGPSVVCLKKAAKLTIFYNETELSGVSEEKLLIKGFDIEHSKWVFLGGRVDSENNCVTIDITKLMPYSVGADLAAPQINFAPIESETGTPTITATITDDTGLDTESITMLIDGFKVDRTLHYEVVTEVHVSYKPSVPLCEGWHTVEIRARDIRDNWAEPQFVTFYTPAVFEINRVFNYPNPFKDKTTIQVELKAEPEDLNIKIYDISGELVIEIEGDEIKQRDMIGLSGGEWLRYEVTWDGRNGAGDRVGSGVYLYRVKAKRGNSTKYKYGKMAIAR